MSSCTKVPPTVGIVWIALDFEQAILFDISDNSANRAA